MKDLRGRLWLWCVWAMVVAMLYFFFSSIVHMPVGALITVALTLTWLVPRPWRIVAPLGIIAELLAITPPLALALAIWSPLFIFWWRGRIEVDVSFSYFILLAVSAALALGIVVAADAYPAWQHIPWLLVALSWLTITTSAGVMTILYGRLF